MGQLVSLTTAKDLICYLKSESYWDGLEWNLWHSQLFFSSYSKFLSQNNKQINAKGLAILYANMLLPMNWPSSVSQDRKIFYSKKDSVWEFFFFFFFSSVSQKEFMFLNKCKYMMMSYYQLLATFFFFYTHGIYPIRDPQPFHHLLLFLLFMICCLFW